MRGCTRKERKQRSGSLPSTVVCFTKATSPFPSFRHLRVEGTEDMFKKTDIVAPYLLFQQITSAQTATVEQQSSSQKTHAGGDENLTAEEQTGSPVRLSTILMLRILESAQNHASQPPPSSPTSCLPALTGSLITSTPSCSVNSVSSGPLITIQTSLVQQKLVCVRAGMFLRRKNDFHSLKSSRISRIR